jgi:hypothetical protein
MGRGIVVRRPRAARARGQKHDFTRRRGTVAGAGCRAPRAAPGRHHAASRIDNEIVNNTDEFTHLFLEHLQFPDIQMQLTQAHIIRVLAQDGAAGFHIREILSRCKHDLGLPTPVDCIRLAFFCPIDHAGNSA